MNALVQEPIDRSVSTTVTFGLGTINIHSKCILTIFVQFVLSYRLLYNVTEWMSKTKCKNTLSTRHYCLDLRKSLPYTALTSVILVLVYVERKYAPINTKPKTLSCSTWVDLRDNWLNKVFIRNNNFTGNYLYRTCSPSVNLFVFF